MNTWKRNLFVSLRAHKDCKFDQQRDKFSLHRALLRIGRV